jgi:two-component system CheB/CheR fusion protein
VGIGASAGGLEALGAFLKNVPPESRASFVVVQHMDPTHKGLLTGLLARVSPLPVVQAEERTRVQPRNVYVIPPNRDLSIVDGVLHLLVPAARRGLRLPIDFFFRSLADDRGERSIGVLLSGMGSDGTLGLRAIRGKAGAAFVQDPASARFDAMPRSAIDQGLADVVGTPEELPARIEEFVEHAGRSSATRSVRADSVDQGALDVIIGLLRTATGHDFSLYKRCTIHRRVERRMGLHKLRDVSQYAKHLRDNPAEADLLFQELLIGVTSFFRDADAWDQLRVDVLPSLIRTVADGTVLRAWIAGCSTGEEAYSLAIVFKEVLEHLQPATNVSLQIFATDLDPTAIQRAPRPLPSEHLGGRLTEQARAVLRRGCDGIPSVQRGPRPCRLCDAERDARPPVHQARPARVQEPAHLPDTGAAAKAGPHVSLRAPAGWRALPRQRRNHR